jgi:hypothetical protein
MRFMVLVKSDKNIEAGVLPSTQLLAQMGKFNEELVNAGEAEIEIRQVFEAEDFGGAGGARGPADGGEREAGSAKVSGGGEGILRRYGIPLSSERKKA